jgi:NAD(P)-dependent dehydrogenase (short-subunit alcohol dehydrogenase family)
MREQKVALVTGVSSGIGEAVAHKLAREGYRVFGTVRVARGSVAPGVELITLDVRDEASVEAGIATILARAERIDALVNNAGVTVIGAIEETRTDQAQALFDVNFFGAVRVTSAVLPAMRAQRAGRIVFVSSLAGILPTPFMGFYSASKHALEGYSESLDHEVRTMGIRSLLVEPGFMKTRIGESATRASRLLDDYAPARSRAATRVAESVRCGEDPSAVADVVARALSAPRPRLRYPVGNGAALLATLRSVMPEAVFDRSVRKGLD